MILLKKLEKINQEAGQRCSAALSKLARRQAEIEFSDSFITEVKKIPSFITSPKLGTGVFLPITGITGSSFVFFNEEDAPSLCDIMMKKEIGITRKLSEFDKEILKEASNILLGNYLTTFSNAIKAELIAGIPYCSFGMFSELLEKLLANFAKDRLTALVVKIKFNIAPIKIEGDLFLLFVPQELKPLVDAL